MTKTMEKVVTGTATDAVTAALAAGPATARELIVRLASQRRPQRASYANVRQVLHRLHEAGVVTRLQRGLYALPTCDITTNGSALKAAKPARCDRPFVVPRVYTDDEIDRAVRGAWAHFEAMNDMHRPEAWA